MSAFIRVVLLGSLLSGPAFAAEEEPLEEIVVTGEFKGPGLWRVTRPGDSKNHVLWIVGDPYGLPQGMQWKSREIEAIVAGAQEILNEPGVSIDSDTALLSWAKDAGFPFAFAADTDRKVGVAYGANNGATSHRRTLYVIDGTGKSAYVAAPFQQMSADAYTQLGQAVHHASGSHH